MQIYENFLMLVKQLSLVIFSPFNRLLILASSSQIASMIAKLIITSIKKKKFSFKYMARYGGMPSSHTVFITSLAFGLALDPNFGWTHPLLAITIIVSALVLVDTVRLRGTIDSLNKILGEVIDSNKELKGKFKLPRFIAHTSSEVIGGIVFSFLYTLIFYLFFYHLFA